MGYEKLTITLPKEVVDILDKWCKSEDRVRSNMLMRMIKFYDDNILSEHTV